MNILKILKFMGTVIAMLLCALSVVKCFQTNDLIWAIPALVFNVAGTFIQNLKIK